MEPEKNGFQQESPFPGADFQGIRWFQGSLKQTHLQGIKVDAMVEMVILMGVFLPSPEK